MHFPFWKKWLSYLRPITLETASSPLNELLEVQLSNGRLMLCTENAVYSYSDLYDNFRDAFTALNIKAMKIQEVLVLGLGLGSIPEMLEKNFDRKYYYTCIEADEEVIVLADKYVLKYLKSSMDVVYADAAEWVWVTEQQFDLLCVDIFVDDSTPSDFRELDFLQQCNELLAENGILIYNCLAYNSTDMGNAQQFYDEIFQHAFAKTQILKLRCNWMLVGFK
jgi:spermidine synthase